MTERTAPVLPVTMMVVGSCRREIGVEWSTVVGMLFEVIMLVQMWMRLVLGFVLVLVLVKQPQARVVVVPFCLSAVIVIVSMAEKVDARQNYESQEGAKQLQAGRNATGPCDSFTPTRHPTAAYNMQDAISLR